MFAHKFNPQPVDKIQVNGFTVHTIHSFAGIFLLRRTGFLTLLRQVCVIFLTHGRHLNASDLNLPEIYHNFGIAGLCFGRTLVARQGQPRPISDIRCAAFESPLIEYCNF